MPRASWARQEFGGILGEPSFYLGKYAKNVKVKSLIRFQISVMPFEKSVGAVVFRREKKNILYLVLRHPSPKTKTSQYWNFPKGHIEKGESWKDTLRREVEEETGIKNLKIFPDFYVWNKYFYRAKGREREKRKKSKIGINIFKIVTYHLAETKKDKVRLSHEHIDHKWLDYKKALDLLTYKQTKKVLEKANRHLESLNPK